MGNPRLGGELGSGLGHQPQSEKLRSKADAETSPCLGSASSTILPILYAHVSIVKKGKLWETVFLLIQNTKVEDIWGGL